MNQTGMYKLSKGPDKKERTNHDDYVRMQKGDYFKKMCYFLYYTSDWFKHQIIKKSSSSNMYINLLFSKQIPYNKILSDRV